MHYFDENIAKEYGVAEAVMFQNISYWVKENKANGVNFHDGRYWTFNSRKAFSVLFVYWTENQVKRIIEKLYNNGLILKGNYNKANYDKTNWYTLSDKGEDIANYKDEAWLNKSNDDAKKSWSEKSEAWAEKSNDEYQSNQPIPDIKHISKLHIEREGKDNFEKLSTQNSTSESSSLLERKENFKEEMNRYSCNYTSEMLNKFFFYWTERTRNGKKMKFELEKTFEIDNRLKYWKSNERSKVGSVKYRNDPDRDYKIDINEINKKSRNIKNKQC